MTVCPYCEQSLSSVLIQEIEGKVPRGKTWFCLAYSCPSCNKVLNVQIDPVALNRDVLAELRKSR